MSKKFCFKKPFLCYFLDRIDVIKKSLDSPDMITSQKFSPVHDLGKISFKDEILIKCGRSEYVSYVESFKEILSVVYVALEIFVSPVLIFKADRWSPKTCKSGLVKGFSEILRSLFELELGI